MMVQLNLPLFLKPMRTGLMRLIEKALQILLTIMSGSKHGTVHYNLLVVGYLYYTNMLKLR